MTHYAAVHGGKNGFQIPVLFHNFLFIGAFFSHVNAYAHGTHDRPVKIVEGRLVTHKCPQLVSGFNGLFGYEGLLFAHDLVFRFDAGGIVFLHIPYIGMPAALHLLLGLINSPAEAVVYLFVNAVLVLVPDQIGNIINRSFEIMIGLPKIPAHLTGLLPTQETETDFVV